MADRVKYIVLGNSDIPQFRGDTLDCVVSSSDFSWLAEALRYFLHPAAPEPQSYTAALENEPSQENPA